MFGFTVRQATSIARRTPLLSYVRHKAAYEGEGKTTVHILNQESEGLMIDTYGTHGFRLNNGVTVLGPMAIFPRTVLSWTVESSADITEESLRFFKLLEPKIDLVIIGMETKDRDITDCVFRAGKLNKLNIEILTTEHACSTFNFLNGEGRSVAAVIIPPLSLPQPDLSPAQRRRRDEDQPSLMDLPPAETTDGAKVQPRKMLPWRK